MNSILSVFVIAFGMAYITRQKTKQIRRLEAENAHQRREIGEMLAEIRRLGGQV